MLMLVLAKCCVLNNQQIWSLTAIVKHWYFKKVYNNFLYAFFLLSVGCVGWLGK